jgi:hypothetical protein
MKPLIYVAGPYAVPDPILNSQRAIECAEKVERYDCAIVIPHLSLMWNLVKFAEVDRWYARDLLVLEHCNAMVRFEGQSTGADKEVAFAVEAGIPVFYCNDLTPPPSFGTWRLQWWDSDI